MKFRILILVLFTSIAPAYTQTNGEKTIRIGLLVSEAPDNDPISQAAIDGANFAIKQQNANVELFIRSCEGPWGITSSQVVDFVYEDEIDALITSVDGRNAHLAEQVATKAHLALISTRATDPTLTQAFVPWFFRVTPDDRVQAKILIETIFNKKKISYLTIIHPDTYNATNAAKHFFDQLSDKQRQNSRTIVYDPLISTYVSLTEKLNSSVEAIVFFGSIENTQDLIQSIHQQFPEIQLFGNQSLIENGSRIGSLPDDMLIVIPDGWEKLSYNEFSSEFQNFYGLQAGLVAQYSYDAMNMLINSIDTHGTDYTIIQENLQNVKYEGLTGTIEFDELGNRVSGCMMGMISEGKIVPVKVYP